MPNYSLLLCRFDTKTVCTGVPSFAQQLIRGQNNKDMCKLMPMESTLLCELQIRTHSRMCYSMPHYTSPLCQQPYKNVLAYMPAAPRSSIQHLCRCGDTTMCASVPQWICFTRVSWFHLREPMCINSDCVILLYCQPIMHWFLSCRHLCRYHQADLCTHLSLHSILFRVQCRSHLCYWLCWWILCWWIHSLMCWSMPNYNSPIRRYFYQLLCWQVSHGARSLWARPQRWQQNMCINMWSWLFCRPNN